MMIMMTMILIIISTHYDDAADDDMLMCLLNIYISLSKLPDLVCPRKLCPTDVVDIVMGRWLKRSIDRFFSYFYLLH